METFVTVIVILAMIALGVLLIHLLNSQHSDRIAAFHYGRSGTPVPGLGPSARRKGRGRARASSIAGRGARRDDGSDRPSRPNRQHRPN
ncbi:hypothetical protein EJ357_24720 [Streptomyces cyaneochromogenes]|uniref:Uncharacterized protein n=1 Tax=Streptomyces cyaneochromogenes TaxID=2496836 RepID=A0A3Q9EV63_9ACTN|nr:hypothetical protein [Streptomyces cyaneochromogenes]AZQ36267.1 hypothetical protein EJ357_24720 [Streptomyces cyaneochromogenes]